jgi:enoyl-CoA hydratase/carnithine racemase
MGGGLGLMAGASHRVVTERSRVAMPEITIGLYPDVGGTWLLNRAPGRSGLFLALTGAQLNAADALFARFADYQIGHADKTGVMQSLMRQPWTADTEDAHRLLTDVLRSVAAARPAPGPLRSHLDLVDELCRYATLPEIIAAIGRDNAGRLAGKGCRDAGRGVARFGCVVACPAAAHAACLAG